MSTEVFPLNIGYIAAYCKKQFGSQVDITLFKYIDELENAIIENPPDILGLSNYVWSHRIGLEMFNLVRAQNPNVVTVCSYQTSLKILKLKNPSWKNVLMLIFMSQLKVKLGFPT